MMKRSIQSLLLVLIAIAFTSLVSCNSTPQNTQSGTKQYFDYGETGMKTAGVKMIPIETPKGTFKVWTKRIGNNPRIKVLLLHGGPGLTHEYLESVESFFPGEGIEFYYYNQLGSAYSDQPNDSSLWTLDRFVEEVEQVRKALNLNKDNFYLYGQSWGGILAMQYALKYQDNLKALIISNMMASFPEYGKYNATLRAQLRPSLLDSLTRYEAANQYLDPVYQQLVMNEFYTRHICRRKVQDWPENVTRSFSRVNNQVYVLMQGPSEFVPGGRLKNWDITAELPKIKVPVLAIGSKYDTMDPKAMEAISKSVQKGTYLYCPEGSHLSLWDDQQHYFPGLIAFIHSVDKGTFKP